ncbi:hypothetical protein AMATHDRAFT_10770 [Amanita thiersii Skay4041]|uniref:Uncharacterized protein n=1 Tax=Amanita thiersii Skay4041 TaxID=703135 RepID=A0A2A9NAR0_9AGAR|nr:hypothetical protein AMATHDRAFT_10770 [Amanita thiersii Skay4041]
MPSFTINSYHNFEVPIPESTTNGLIEAITARPLLQNLLQDVSALSSHVNNMRMVQLACLPVQPTGAEYIYLSECGKHVALENSLPPTPTIMDGQPREALREWGESGEFWKKSNLEVHRFPFKKAKKTQPNSGTGFFYIAPGYKLSMEEIHKVQSKNFNTNSYAEELRRKELLALRKLPPKSVDKSKISRPRPLRPPQNNVVLHYDNHIRLYRKHINSLQLDNHVRLYRQHIIKMKKQEEKQRATELAIWRYNESISQREQDEAWDILQHLKQKQWYEDLQAKKRQDEEIWTTIQCLKRKDRYEDLQTKRRQDYARSHAYQMESLNQNLEYHPDLRRSLLKDPKNQFLTWLRGGVELLQKYGWSISNKECNRFQHSLNGNHIPLEIAERLPLVIM